MDTCSLASEKHERAISADTRVELILRRIVKPWIWTCFLSVSCIIPCAAEALWVVHNEYEKERSNVAKGYYPVRWFNVQNNVKNKW